MTAQELKMTAWEMDATASALEANLDTLDCVLETQFGSYRRYKAVIRALDEVASLQAYAHALQAEAAKEGAA